MDGLITLLVLTINLPVLTAMEQVISPINREKGYLFDNFPGYKLSLKDDNFYQRTISVPDKMKCVFACIGATWCFSANFDTTTQKNGGLHTCELMSTLMHDNPKNLTADKNFIHLSIKNPCTEKPCHNDGGCIIDNNRQDYKCNCKKGFSGEKCNNAFVTIFVLSEGKNINEIYNGKCIIKVNNGEDHCPNTRGHNIVVLNKFGVYQEKRVFDTHGDKNAGVNMRNYLNNLPNERIVLISIMDSGDNYVGDAAAALRSIGSVNPTAVGYRTPWLLVGYKGGSPSWITEKSADQYKGPIQANVTIPVPVT